jgi:hypothetical protein
MECFVHPDDDGGERPRAAAASPLEWVVDYGSMPVRTEPDRGEPILSTEEIYRILGSFSAPRYRTWNDIGD